MVSRICGSESEQAEVKDVDHYQIVSPVEQVEDKEYRREEVHGNPGNITLFRIRLICMFSSERKVLDEAK